MSPRKTKGVNARAWFYGQSFHGGLASSQTPLESTLQRECPARDFHCDSCDEPCEEPCAEPSGNPDVALFCCLCAQKDADGLCLTCQERKRRGR
jgi:hypothetical protein